MTFKMYVNFYERNTRVIRIAFNLIREINVSWYYSIFPRYWLQKNFQTVFFFSRPRWKFSISWFLDLLTHIHVLIFRRKTIFLERIFSTSFQTKKIPHREKSTKRKTQWEKSSKEKKSFLIFSNGLKIAHLSEAFDRRSHEKVQGPTSICCNRFNGN